MPEPLMQALATSEVREAVTLLRKLAGGVALAAAACMSTFVLAEAALPDGEEATTTWWPAPLFRQRYALVRLDESRIVVQSHAVVCGVLTGRVDPARMRRGYQTRTVLPPRGCSRS
jgi:transcriptional regulator GlxA family with amidase domain